MHAAQEPSPATAAEQIIDASACGDDLHHHLRVSHWAAAVQPGDVTHDPADDVIISVPTTEADAANTASRSSGATPYRSV
jgi:hypothetical protein